MSLYYLLLPRPVLTVITVWPVSVTSTIVFFQSWERFLPWMTLCKRFDCSFKLDFFFFAGLWPGGLTRSLPDLVSVMSFIWRLASAELKIAEWWATSLIVTDLMLGLLSRKSSSSLGTSLGFNSVFLLNRTLSEFLYGFLLAHVAGILSELGERVTSTLLLSILRRYCIVWPTILLYGLSRGLLCFSLFRTCLTISFSSEASQLSCPSELGLS